MKCLACLVYLSLFLVPVAQSQIINTVAGTGKSGFSGDSAQAINAELAHPIAVATDAAGNIYITDNGNSRIRKISLDGIITTFAGTGEHGFSGDGGPAIKAKFADPGGIAVDGAGNVYIADYGNNRIRKIDDKGIITTVAGGGGNISADDQPATSIYLFGPTSVTADNDGNLYFPAGMNIYKVNAGGIIKRIAGNGNIGYAGDGGPAIDAVTGTPTGIAVNSAGEIFFTQSSYHRVRKIDKNGIITTIAGTGEVGFDGDGGLAISALLHNPYAVTTAGNDIFIADEFNGAVRKVDANGIITTVAGTGKLGYSGDGGPATNAKLSDIGTVAVDKKGNLFIADFSNNRVRKVTGLTLPITLATFVGKLVNANAVLQWQTATEQNSKQFNIMRSLDGTSFTAIGSVNAVGKSSTVKAYTYTDVNVAALKTNQVFYKLQCVDKDGSATYTKTVRLQLNTSAFSILAYPNPAKNLLWIKPRNGHNKLAFSIFDAAGRRLAVIGQEGGGNIVTFNTASLAAGVYIISTIVDGKKYEQKFIKE